MKRKNIKIQNVSYIVISLIISFVLFSCEGRNRRNSEDNDKNTQSSTDKDTLAIDSDTIQNKLNNKTKVYFYIENSASIFGYINGFTDYIDVVNELAAMPKFEENNIEREYYFINGRKDLKVNYIGSSKEGNILVDKFNKSKNAYNSGDVSASDLNTMFQLALQKASDNDISILISDGIYDIKDKRAPKAALVTEGKNTRTQFINRLSQGDLQTILVKLQSDFNGKYYFVTKYNAKGRQKYIKIKQKRPYYIWIFGKSELLNEYFTDEYLSSLKGFNDLVRFLKNEKTNIPYEISNKENIGRFDFDRDNPKMLKNVSFNERDNIFQFSFKVDYSTLPFPNEYFTNVENYECIGTGKYNVKKIVNINDKKYTHLITVYTKTSPYGKLSVNLKNVLPDWIEKTSTLEENETKVDESTTFGFKFLIDGISEAYIYMNKGNKYIATFEFILTK
ncbi:MAG: hypothetical protein GXO49_01015 [Chlorobi bacterium]|nr:hypothetical protein [Chlorobiota bacterium]